MPRQDEPGDDTGPHRPSAGVGNAGTGTTPDTVPVTSFHGRVHLDDTRPIKHFGDIAKEVLDQFAGLAGADLDVTIEITAHQSLQSVR